MQSISPFSFDELVIGAPMYTDIRRAATEIGRVYVFNNTGVSNHIYSGFLSWEKTFMNFAAIHKHFPHKNPLLSTAPTFYDLFSASHGHTC